VPETVWNQSIALLCSAVAEVPSAEATEATEKRRGPKKLAEMTAEQRAAHDARKAERKAKKEAAAAAAAQAPAEAEAPAAAEVPAEAEPAKRRGPKKLAEMTAEERAAHDAKKAERAAAKAVSAAVEDPSATSAVAEKAAPAEAAAKRRGPKKLTEMTAEERAVHDAKKAERAAAKKAPPAAAAAPAAAAEVPEGEPVVVAGKTYIRLADGRCYEPGDNEEELGAFAGVMRKGILDITAKED